MGILGRRFGITRYEADEYYRIALDYYNKKNLEEAINNITSAIEFFPRRAEYHSTRGFFKLVDGIPDQAELEFDNALKLHAYDMLANFGKGAIAYGREEYEVARDYFLNAWASKQDRPETLYYLGMVEHRLRNNQKALEWMRQAESIFASFPETNKEARKRQKDAERWIREFEKLAKKQSQQS
jgi:Tfp pilus assembly protein PilF